MKNFAILLLLLCFVACGADDFESGNFVTHEDQPLYYVHTPLGVDGKQEPILLGEIKEPIASLKTPRFSLPITDELRQMLFPTAEELLDHVRFFPATHWFQNGELELQCIKPERLENRKVSDQHRAISEIPLPEEVDAGELNFLDLLRYWKIREAQESYYTRYVSSDGIITIGSDDVTEDEFRIAHGIILTMTSKHPILRKQLTPEIGWKMIIVPEGKTLLDLPEYMGIESIRFYGVCGGGGCISPLGRFGYGAFVHEMGHAIHFAIKKLDPNFDSELQILYEKAMAAGKYENMYAASNSWEYFAEGVKWWFLGHDNFDTREKMREYDPDLVELLEEWLPETDLLLE